MSVPLYFDHHVNIAILNGLRAKGIDVLTCAEDGTMRWADDLLLERVSQQGRAIFTQDTDFLKIAEDWQLIGRDFSAVVYAKQGRITIGRAIRDLELIANVFDSVDLRNRI